MFQIVNVILINMHFLLSSPRPCCHSANLQSWPAPSGPAPFPVILTLLPSSLVLVLPQLVWLVLELESEQCLAALSLAMPGNVFMHQLEGLHSCFGGEGRLPVVSVLKLQ